MKSTSILATVLDIVQIIDVEGIITTQLLEKPRQVQIALGYQELLYQQIATQEEDATALEDEFLGDSPEQMRLAAAGKPKRQDVFEAIEESAFQQDADVGIYLAARDVRRRQILTRLPKLLEQCGFQAAVERWAIIQTAGKSPTLVAPSPSRNRPWAEIR